MKRASYRDAIWWLVHNDDTDWLESPNNHNSVTSALVADLFGVGDERVRKDALRELKKRDAEERKNRNG